MKKLLYLSLIITLMAACTNDAQESTNETPQTKTDSLLKDVLADHDEAMAAQMTKMEKTKKELTRLLDSLNKLPSKANQASAFLKKNIDTALVKLNAADAAMNTWMEEFNYDSAKNDVEERVRYLTNEKLRVGNVKEAIMGSLKKADSLLKEF